MDKTTFPVRYDYPVCYSWSTLDVYVIDLQLTLNERNNPTISVVSPLHFAF